MNGICRCTLAEVACQEALRKMGGTSTGQAPAGPEIRCRRSPSLLLSLLPPLPAPRAQSSLGPRPRWPRAKRRRPGWCPRAFVLGCVVGGALGGRSGERARADGPGEDPGLATNATHARRAVHEGCSTPTRGTLSSVGGCGTPATVDSPDRPCSSPARFHQFGRRRPASGAGCPTLLQLFGLASESPGVSCLSFSRRCKEWPL